MGVSDVASTLGGVPSVIDPSEIADALRRVAELQHDLLQMRSRLGQHEAPLALLAARAIERAEVPLEQAREWLYEGAQVITAVQAD